MHVSVFRATPDETFKIARMGPQCLPADFKPQGHASQCQTPFDGDYAVRRQYLSLVQSYKCDAIHIDDIFCESKLHMLSIAVDHSGSLHVRCGDVHCIITASTITRSIDPEQDHPEL